MKKYTKNSSVGKQNKSCNISVFLLKKFKNIYYYIDCFGRKCYIYNV